MNPYSSHTHADVAPMSQAEYERLCRVRLVGRFCLAFAFLLYFCEPFSVVVNGWELTSEALLMLSLFGFGVQFLRGMRCRTRRFQRMCGFVRYEAMQAKLNALDGDEGSGTERD